MDYKTIRVHHGFHNTVSGRLIIKLCNELQRRDRAENIRIHGYKQIIRFLKAKICMLENKSQKEAA